MLSVTDDTGEKPDPQEGAGEKPTTEPATTPETGDGDPTEGLRSALKSEREARKAGEKRTRELEARLREIEDKDKSETERLTERAAESERRASEAEARLLRYEIAAEKKLNADAIPLLHGTTREEIEASADALAAYAKNQEKAAPGFDGGARKTPAETKPPEDAHRDVLMGILGRGQSER